MNTHVTMANENFYRAVEKRPLGPVWSRLKDVIVTAYWLNKAFLKDFVIYTTIDRYNYMDVKIISRICWAFPAS
jgi:hypothetical protein